ncbi:MAG: hypothetical protein AAF353_11470 [Pseudomonadota bacterium]
MATVYDKQRAGSLKMRVLPLLFFWIVLGFTQGVLANNQTCSHGEPKRIVLATAIPVLDSMARTLTRDTTIDVLYLAPPRNSIKRVPGWVARQSVEQFPRADLILAMTSVWPDIDVYPYLRSQNIAIIPIDAAQAMIPGGERVAVNQSAEKGPGYFWLNPSNALLMLGIIQRDLIAVLEQICLTELVRNQSIEKLKLNFDNASKRLRLLQVELDGRLGNLDVLQVAVEKPEQLPLAQATLLPETGWAEAVESGIPTLLITARKVGHKKLADLPSHVHLWHIDDFGKVRDDDFLTRWQALVAALGKFD